MKNESPLAEKSYAFSLQIVNLCRAIADNHHEYILTKQLIRSGTSIGANIQEASDAESRKDFISKLKIALKEAKESLYWMKLIRDTQLHNKETMESYIRICDELKFMLIASIKTAKSNA